MSSLARKPLCDRCRLDGGWDTTDPDNVIRCAHNVVATPEQERDAAIGATTDAHPDAMRAALAIIRETALSMPLFSSNDTRSRMRIAQVPGEVVGAAFRQAAKDRVIRGDSYLPSTDPGTHSHPVRQWASLVYRRGVA